MLTVSYFYCTVKPVTLDVLAAEKLFPYRFGGLFFAASIKIAVSPMYPAERTAIPENTMQHRI